MAGAGCFWVGNPRLLLRRTRQGANFRNSFAVPLRKFAALIPFRGETMMIGILSFATFAASLKKLDEGNPELAGGDDTRNRLAPLESYFSVC